MLKSVAISRQTLIILVAAYFTLVLNLPFWRLLGRFIAAENALSSAFLASLPFTVFSVSWLVLNLLAWGRLTKTVLVFLVLLSSPVFYASWTYGIAFDYGMLENIIETNSNEVFSYLSFSFLGCFGLTGLLPGYLIIKTRINNNGIRQAGLSKLSGLIAPVLLLVLIGGSLLPNYASFARSHSHLKKYLIPTQWLGSSFNLFQDRVVYAHAPYQLLGLDASIKSDSSRPRFIVVLVGETARSSSFAYGGYQRQTNQYTSRQDLIAYPNIDSCGTSTVVSVPCMFSFLTQRQFSYQSAQYQDNVLDVIQRAGYKVTWVDNNSSCKGVCQHIETEKIVPGDGADCVYPLCYDSVLVKKVAQHLSASGAQNQLLVLHMIGSHGPDYYRRYPADFTQFLPDCQRSDIENCSHEELINSYDNTILYTDFVIAQINELLAGQASKFASALMYISDHGESLGENGLYLHGAPYWLAPEQQTKVPALVWFSDNYIQDHHFDRDCLRKSQQNRYSHDYISHSLMSLTGVKSEIFDASLDLFSGCLTDQRS